jgi:hypothetical protein
MTKNSRWNMGKKKRKKKTTICIYLKLQVFEIKNISSVYDTLHLATRKKFGNQTKQLVFIARYAKLKLNMILIEIQKE